MTLFLVLFIFIFGHKYIYMVLYVAVRHYSKYKIHDILNCFLPLPLTGKLHSLKFPRWLTLYPPPTITQEVISKCLGCY